MFRIKLTLCVLQNQIQASVRQAPPPATASSRVSRALWEPTSRIWAGRCASPVAEDWAPSGKGPAPSTTVRSKVSVGSFWLKRQENQKVQSKGCSHWLSVFLSTSPCSSVFSRSLLQHHSAPVHPLPCGDLSDRVQTELLHHLPRKHHHGLRRGHERVPVQEWVWKWQFSVVCVWFLNQRLESNVFCVCVSRQAMRWGDGRVHGLHWVTELPRELPRQRGMHLEHQPAQQTQDPHRGAGDLPALRGRVWRRVGDEEELWVPSPLPGFNLLFKKTC